MLLGQSLFQSVVDRLTRENTETPEPSTAETGFRIRGLNSSFVKPTENSAAPGGRWAEDHYLDFMPDRADLPHPATQNRQQDAIPDMPAHLKRLSAAEIAEDLGLSDNDTSENLHAKRRAYALHNHPDRVHPAFHAAAHHRMTLANQMIDRALKRLSR